MFGKIDLRGAMKFQHYRKLMQFCLLLCLILLSACERHQRAEVKKEKIGDVDIAYYVRGNGPPLVMIMGFRGTMAAWDPGLLKNLEKHFTLILFDNRGVGLSSDTEENVTTISQMANDTAKLIETLGYSKVNILGWSMGSRIALQLAMDHAQVIESLILCSPNPGGKFQAPRKSHAYEELTGSNLSDEQVLSLIFPDSEKGHVAKDAFVTRLAEAIILRNVPDDLKISDRTIGRQARALKLWDEDDDYYAALPQIKIPTLVASGLDDALDQPQNARIIACRIPFAWSAYFAGSGHNFLSQNYEEFSNLVRLFIDSNQNKTQ